MFTTRPVSNIAYVCARCLRQSRRRQYSTQADNIPPGPPPSGAVKLSTRKLISLHGPDAPKFLQGLVTANIRPDSRTGLYTAFLTAPGKVLNDVFIYPTLGSRWHDETNKDGEQGYLVEVDGEQVDGLLKHLKRHKLRSKFKLRLVEDGELDVWSLWKEDERWTAHTKAENDGRIISLTDSRAPGMGQRLILPPATSKDDLHGTLEGVQETDVAAYNIRRYLKGVAEGQFEIPREESLPMNSNIDIMGGIDFKKGCYVGQELTIRTHHTGVVRRRILPIALYDYSQEAPEKLEFNPSQNIATPEHNEDIRRDDKRKRPTGKFITSIGNVGLAMCRLEQMSDLTVSGEGSSFAEGDRFMMQTNDGQEVGIKAFVPDWVRGQIREPKIQRRVG